MSSADLWQGQGQSVALVSHVAEYYRRLNATPALSLLPITSLTNTRALFPLIARL
jgi:hypothetical protein